MRRFPDFLGLIVLTMTVFAVIPANANGPGGGGAHAGGYHGGGNHAGGYHPGGGYHYGGFYQPYHGYAAYHPYGYGLYAPYGFYRPYGYGFGPTLGFGGLTAFGGGGYGFYRPYYGGTVIAPTVVVVPGAGGPGLSGAPGVGPGLAGSPPLPGEPPLAGAGTNQTPPPPDNAAHLQLVVPENAEVVFEGNKTTQTGPMREFVSPALPAGKAFNYTIAVRYTDGNGKAINDRRVIQVHANDWFRIDFTRPAPPEAVPQP